MYTPPEKILANVPAVVSEILLILNNKREINMKN